MQMYLIRDPAIKMKQKVTWDSIKELLVKHNDRT